MLKSISRKQIYFAGLLLIAIGLTLSPAFMSIGQVIIVLNWLFDSDLKDRYSSTWKNKSLLAFLLIFIIHIFGLMYTENFQYAIKDLKIKLPLLLIPIVIAGSSALDKRELNFIYIALLSSVFISSIISLYLYITIDNSTTDNLRSISPIISHIRLSLIACVSFFISIYFALEYRSKKISISIAMLLYALWMLYFISILGARAGYLSILVASIVVIFYKCIQYKKYSYIFLSVGFFILTIWFAYQFSKPVQKRVDEVFSEVQSHNKGANPSGKSISQRFVYWNIAQEIFKENKFIGTGTGDIDDAFKNYYESHETNLEKSYQHRAHNQYITMLCTFGLFGFVIFVIAILYPYLKNKLYFDMLATSFLIIFLISMLTEDTLETQAGATFVAFFYALFILRKQPLDKQKVSY